MSLTQRRKGAKTQRGKGAEGKRRKANIQHPTFNAQRPSGKRPPNFCRGRGRVTAAHRARLRRYEKKFRAYLKGLKTDQAAEYPLPEDFKLTLGDVRDVQRVCRIEMLGS